MSDENFTGVRATTADEEAVMFQQSWIKAERENARLREEVAAYRARKPVVYSPDAQAMSDRVKAAEAERDALREENARLREALKPFSDRLDGLEKMKTSKYACVAVVEIKHLRAARAAIAKARGETARMYRQGEMKWRLLAENTRLREENARLREAVGLMTTMAPFMEMDVDDPVGMAKTVVVEQEKLFQENARLREALKPLAATIKGQFSDMLFGSMPDNSTATVILQLGHLRAARAALKETGE